MKNAASTSSLPRCKPWTNPICLQLFTKVSKHLTATASPKPSNETATAPALTEHQIPANARDKRRNRKKTGTLSAKRNTKARKPQKTATKPHITKNPLQRLMQPLKSRSQLKLRNSKVVKFYVSPGHSREILNCPKPLNRRC